MSVSSAAVDVKPIESSVPNNHGFALLSLTTLFFMWGFITCLNDILIPHLKGVFQLNYTQAMLVQFCFFGAYFVVSLPAGAITERLGYKKGIVLGLLVASLGCLLFYPAAGQHSYPLFLSALFVLASGITLLQVSANPYVSILGPENTASSRLTMTQAFNSLGTTVAPFFGAILILSVATQSIETMTAAQQKIAEAEAVQIPYLLLAGALLVLAAIFAYIKLPDIKPVAVKGSTSLNSPAISAWQHRHLVLGALAIFLYVGAEVAIGSFLVSFLGQADIAGLAESEAAHYITYYWGGAMVGRFIGAGVMQKVNAGTVLAFNACCAVILITIAVVSSGSIAMWGILGVGLCNSIMFPTIFSLAIQKLGESTSQGSGILCLAIVGGAILPLIQGVLADYIGIQVAFLLPLVCYIYIATYGIWGKEPRSIKP